MRPTALFWNLIELDFRSKILCNEAFAFIPDQQRPEERSGHPYPGENKKRQFFKIEIKLLSVWFVTSEQPIAI